jgi:hypothetical protein
MNSRIDPEHIAILAALLVGWSILTIVRYLIIPAVAMLAGMRKPRQESEPPTYELALADHAKSKAKLLALQVQIQLREGKDSRVPCSTFPTLLPRPVRKPPDDNG